MQDSRFIRGGFGYSSWVERLSKGSTFKNWNLSRPKFPTRWSSNYGNLKREEIVDRESLEVTNGNIKGSVEPSKKGSSETLTRNVNGRMGSMESSTRRPVRQRKRKLRHLILLGILIVLGLIIALLVPILVIMVLSKGGTDENVSKVDIEVTIQNMQYTDAFADKGSQEYINFKDKFCSEIGKQYQTSDLADSYDGCVVTDVRRGSLIVMFSVVFISRRLPLQSTVKSVLTSSRVTLDTGQVQIKLGVYILEDAAIVIGQVTVIRKDENPIPRIKYKGTCRLDSSCITKQAECINRRCLCPSSRNHDDQKDHCFLYKSLPSTVSTTTPTMPTTLSTTISTKITSPAAATSKTMSLPQTASSSSETVPTSLLTTTYSASSTKSSITSSETAMSPTSTTILTTSTKPSTHTTTRKTTDSSGTISTEKVTLPTTTIKTTSPSQIIISSPATIPMSLSSTKDSATPTAFQTTSSETAISSTYSSFLKTSKSHATAKGSTTSERSTLPTFSTTMLSKQSDKITASSALTTNPPATTKAVTATTTSQTQTGPIATKTTAIPLTRTMDITDATKAMSTTTPANIPSTSITTTSRVPTTKVIPTTSIQISTSSKRITTGSTKEAYPTKLTSDTLRSTEVTLPTTSFPASSAKVTDPDDLTRTTKATAPETTSTISTRAPLQMTSSANPSSSSTTKILTSSAKTASLINSTKSTDTTTPISISTSSTRTTLKEAATSFSTGSGKTTISTSLKEIPTTSGKTINSVTTRKNKAKTEFPSSASPFTSSTTSVPAKSTSPAPSAAPSSYSGSNTIQNFTSAPNNGELKVVISYIPPLNKLEIGEVEMIIFEVVNARNVTAIRLEQTTDSVQLISNITFSDDTMKKTYGPGRRSHMDVSVDRSEDEAVINVTLTFSPVHCYDAATYRCKVTPKHGSSEAAETSEDIGVYKRPEKPYLTLSYDIVDGQEPWSDRPSKCEGEVGYPAGYFVVEVLMSGTFADYTDWWPLNAQEKETDCGTSKTQPFVFYPNQTDYLNNKQIRCAIRNDNPISDEKLPVSEAKTIHVVKSDYCEGISRNFYENPYECHAFVDCSAASPGNMHFQLCRTSNTCPNRETGCDVASCTTLCNREITKTTGKITTTTTTQLPLEDPYMRCNHTVEGNIDSSLIINCVLGNTDDSFVGNITVYKEQNIFISGSGNEGIITADEQSATLTYTSSTIKLEIASLACHQAGTYTFVVNELLERSVMVVAKKRPEKPHLTLSYDIVDGQEPWGDRASKCEGEVGNPAGYFVVEVLMSGSFVNYTDWWPLNAQQKETDCGTYKTQTFVFYSDTLDYLNGKKIRCAVRNDNPIPEENLPVSDAKTIHVVQSDYCEGIDWQVYEHPYECHAFVDCSAASPENMHFKLCGSPHTCPNRETGCDVASCTTLCNREFTTATTTQLPLEDPYIRCNHTVEGYIDSTLIIYCVLGNTDNSFVENITVFKDQDIFLSGNGNEGTITVDEQSATLTYTASAIKLEIASLACQQAGIYTFVVNELLERSVVVVATAYPEEPILTVGEFITNHQASIRCEGNLGYPKGTTDMQLQTKFAGDTKFMVMTEGVSAFEESYVLNCTTVKTLETKLIVTSDWNSAQLQCVTNANSAIFESPITTIDLQQQSVYIILENPSAEIGKQFNITCEIVDVSELSSISFFRNDQLVCRSVIDIVTSSEEDIVCTSKFDTSGGTLDISFLSIQCRDEGEYRCAPNTEASTAATVYLQVTREQHNNPSMISMPKTLIANTQMLYAESFTCKGEVDYPSGRRSVVLQTNKNGQFESYFNGERSTQISRDGCRVNDTLVVKLQTFDTTWNNTQLRCAIEDNGEDTNFVSEEYTLQLLPDNYCEENPERSPHPLECHYHIWCTPALYVFDCSPLCPVVTNGNNTDCLACSVPCH